jgi:hypothetical protein
MGNGIQNRSSREKARPALIGSQESADRRLSVFRDHPLVAAWSGETDGSFCLGREASGAGLRGVTAADIRQWSRRSPDRIVTVHRSWLGSFVTNVSWPSRRGSKHFENVRPAGEEDLDLVGVVRQTNTVDVGTGVNRVQDLEALLAPSSH